MNTEFNINTDPENIGWTEKKAKTTEAQRTRRNTEEIVNMVLAQQNYDSGE
jgi:hypothetical protein